MSKTFNAEQSRRYSDSLYILLRGELSGKERKFAEMCYKNLGNLSDRACSELTKLIGKYLKSGESCRHIWVRIQRVDVGEHYGRRVCKDCGAFLGYEPFPPEPGLAGLIDKLRKSGKLNHFENEFLHSIRDATTLTKAQRAMLDEIKERLGYGRKQN